MLADSISAPSARVIWTRGVARSALFLLGAVFLGALIWSVVDGLLRLRGLTFDGHRASPDASAMFFGQPLYGDPTRGYSSSVYTPLLPVLGAMLDHIRFWRSWTPLISLVSSLVMVAVVARVVYDGRDRRLLVAVAEAAGAGAFLYWLVGQQGQGSFTNDSPDQLSWTLGILALLTVPRAARSNAFGIAMVLLLSASFWAKQTGLVAAGACLAILVVDAGRPRASWLRVATLAGGFVLLNGLLVFMVNQLTEGWFVRIAFEWPTRQPCCDISPTLIGYLKGFMVEFFVQFLFGSLLFVALLIAVVILSRRRPCATRRDLRSAFPFAVFSILALVGALVTRQRTGAETNHELGLAWGLALLMAVGYRHLKQTTGGTVILVALIGVIVAGSQLLASRQLFGNSQSGYLTVPALRPSIDWTAAPPQLAVYARHHRVFVPDDGDISVNYAHEAFPTWFDLSGFTYVGRMPAFLARMIINRRFDLVFPYGQPEVAAPLMSGNGKYEENYLWKIDQAIQLEYRPSASAPDGGRVPIAGANPAPWIGRCFGPYTIDGIALQQHVGGGFWCPHESSISLRSTPAPFADLQTPVERAIAGTIRVRLSRPGSYRIVLAYTHGRTTWERTGHLNSGGTTVAIGLPAATHAASLILGATRTSGAAFNLAQLRVRTHP